MNFKDFIAYNLHEGSFKIKRNAKYKELLPKEDGYLYFFYSGKKYKVRASKLAYELGTGNQVPKGKQILHKNLNKTDLRLCNLTLVTNKQMNQINEAHRNLTSDLKMQPHKQDFFAYVITWVEGNQTRHKVVHDVVNAKNFYIKLQLKFAKILGKYLVLD